MSKRRFKIVEYASGFAVYDTVSKLEKWISDGVDLLFTKTGRAVSPGCKTFNDRLEKALNEDESETEEAYFPEIIEGMEG